MRSKYFSISRNSIQVWSALCLSAAFHQHTSFLHINHSNLCLWSETQIQALQGWRPFWRFLHSNASTWLQYCERIWMIRAKKRIVFQEVVSHFPCPTVEQTCWRGGRPGRSDAWVPLGGVGKRFVDPFSQVGQESDDCEIIPKVLHQNQPARPNCETRFF